MHKKMLATTMAVVMILTALFSLSSCSGKQEYPVTVGSVTIEGEPEQIVILSKNLADVISYMGYDIKMTGRSDEVTQEGLQVVPTVGTSKDPEPASIDEVGADVVFADSTINETVKQEIEESGTPVIVLDDAQTPKQLRSLYKKIGIILGGNVTGKADAIDSVNSFIDTMNEIEDAIISEQVIKTTCYLYIDNGVLKTMHSGNWGSVLLGYTGTTNVFANADSNVVDNETLLLSNPDYIFCSDESVIDYLKRSSTLGELDALKSNAYVIPYEDITMQGVTALDVVEEMLQYIYPDQFRD